LQNNGLSKYISATEKGTWATAIGGLLPVFLGQTIFTRAFQPAEKDFFDAGKDFRFSPRRDFICLMYIFISKAQLINKYRLAVLAHHIISLWHKDC
jgi:hypothetical protein